MSIKPVPTEDLRYVEEFFELAGDLFCVTDQRGYFLRLNRAWEQVLGYSRAELVSRPFIDFVHPDDVAATQAEMSRLVRGEAVTGFVNRYRHCDGSWRRLRWQTTAPTGGSVYYAVAHDVTAEIDQYERAQRSEERFRTLFDNAGEGICVADARDGRLLQVNQAFLAFLGRESGEVLGRHVTDFHPEEIREGQALLFRAAAEAGSAHLPEVPFLHKDGSCVFATISATLMDLEGVPCVVGYLTDVSAQRTAQVALADREAQYRAVIDASLDGFFVADLEGRLLEVNDVYVNRSGYSREELLRMRIIDLEALESEEATREHVAEVARAGGALFETLHRTRGGVVWKAEVNVTYWAGQGGRFFVFVRDINQRKRSEQLLRTRMHLLDLAERGTTDDLLQATLDAAELFTGSNIGFFHFVDPDGETLRLQTWSTNTLANMCTAEGKGQHYPVSEAGVWADCVREKRAVLINDYPGYAAKRGMPEGHAPVTRVANIPVFQGNRITAVIGVGNKQRDYDDEDVALLTELATMAMEVVDRRRNEDRLKLASSVYESSRDAIMVLSPDQRIAAVNPAFVSMIGLGEKDLVDHEAAMLLPGGKDDPIFRPLVDELGSHGAWQGELRLKRASGDVFPAWGNFNSVRDNQGRVIHFSAIISDLSRAREIEERLAFLSQFDPLTRLPNRSQFDRRLEHAVARGQRRNSKLALLLIDLDGFKVVNDSLGHPVGDRLLQLAAERIRGRLRAEDVLARVGGDEFAILLDELPAPETAGLLARDLVLSLASPFTLDEHEILVGASIGISVFPDDGDEGTTLMRNADAAVFGAKAAGRGTFRFYASEMTAAALERVEMQSRLRRAIDNSEFLVYYQPQVSLADGRMIGVEALVRWRDPEKGLVSPAAFIPVAEATGQIAPIGEYVLRTACQQVKSWADLGLPPITLAVNLSPKQFHHENLVGLVKGVLADSELPPGQLELEITESAIMERGDQALATLHELKALGVKLAIDDFGTGYSSLSYLKLFPVDKLKIDQSFVRDIPNDLNDMEIASTIIAMAQHMRLQVLAEGVETEAQRNFLVVQGCHYFQGYLFAKPLPPVECSNLLRDNGKPRP